MTAGRIITKTKRNLNQFEKSNSENFKNGNKFNVYKRIVSN
jgi:hypothetical protein